MATSLKRLVGLGLVAAALTSGTAFASNTPQGLKADGLRLQGMAQAYEHSLNGSTPQGVKADGLRLQGMAQVYERSAASFYTPRALRAEGLRWEAMARAYDAGTVPARSTSSDGFDWVASLIGGASILGFGAVGVALILGTRRVRRTKLAV
jgi:hypothetical protein